MRYSDAIERGSLLVPQCFNALMTQDNTGNVTAACAQGAAVLYSGMLQFGQGSRTRTQAPESLLCPECGAFRAMLLSALAVHLNDDHRMDRVTIAQRVREIEDAFGITDNWPSPFDPVETAAAPAPQEAVATQ